MCQFRAVLVKGKPKETAVVLVAQSRITMETVGCNEMEKTIISCFFFFFVSMPNFLLYQFD